LKNLRLDKSSLIKKSAEFSSIIRRGSVYKGSYFTLFVVKEDKLRIGFSVKRGMKSVDRNRLKRRTRELWRAWRGEFDLSGDLIVITREQALSDSFKLLEQDFRRLLEQISLHENQTSS